MEELALASHLPLLVSTLVQVLAGGHPLIPVVIVHNTGLVPEHLFVVVVFAMVWSKV